MAFLLAGILSLTLSPLTGNAKEPDVLRLATTTSTADSGLLEAILPDFEAREQTRVDVIAVGTGQALALGRAGDADVLLVHAREKEELFLAAGHASQRQDVMFNDFILIGPATDPADTKAAADILDALQRVAYREATFASRGDDSGTHLREAQLWNLAGVQPEPQGGWYHSLGQGMGATLTYANERGAYTLSDRGTFLSQAKNLSALKIHIGGDSIADNRDHRLRNAYGVLVVSESKPGVNVAAAQSFARWITSPPTQKKIADFRSSKAGKPLFYPAKMNAGTMVSDSIKLDESDS